MNTININIDILEQKIQKLRDLKTTCQQVDMEPESIVGSGESISIIKSVDEKYVEIKTAIINLLDNSILFFESVKKSEMEADEEAAKKIK